MTMPEPSPQPIQPAQILPPQIAEVGTLPEGKLERAISAILHGIAILEESQDGGAKKQGPLTKSNARTSIEHLQSLLVPSVYQSGKHYKFTFRQQRLLFYLGETGDFRRSCAMADMSEADAAKFLGKGKFPKFFRERVNEAAINRGWSADHFIAELDKVWTGQKIVSREQMDAIKEIGARKAPKIERIQHEFDGAEFIFTTKD